MNISSFIEKYIISNPLSYQYWDEILIRLAIIIAMGLIFVVIFNVNNLKGMTKSITFKKLIGWMIMAPTFLISVMCGGVVALLLISFIVYSSLKEFVKLFYLPKFYFFGLNALWLISVIITILPKLFEKQNILNQFIYILPIIYLISISVLAIMRGRLDNIMQTVTYSFFAIMWIGFSMLHFILLSQLQFGKEFLFIIGFAVALSDVFAFIIGNLFKKIGFGINYKIAKNISVNKTYAGILGNIMGASIGVFIMPFNLGKINTTYKIILILVIAIASSLGDMLESLIKRSANVKDASKVIPGHGGFLDRFDSLFIVIVASYYYLLFILEVIK